MDWKEPIGYFIAIIWESISAYILLHFVISLALFALGNFLFAFSLAKKWKCNLRTIEKMVKAKPYKANVSESIKEFVRTHSYVKELS